MGCILALKRSFELGFACVSARVFAGRRLLPISGHQQRSDRHRQVPVRAWRQAPGHASCESALVLRLLWILDIREIHQIRIGISVAMFISFVNYKMQFLLVFD